MNCAEVGELMQRDLDFDLNEQELKIMMDHLSECSNCSQLFEKLTLLSGSLDQLPRVTPSINIVDAILPELERIDHEKQLRQQDILRKKSVRRRWYTGFGSIAAAAIVIVAMTTNYGLPDNNGRNNNVAINNSIERASYKQIAEMSTDVSNDHQQLFSMQEEGQMAADSELPYVVIEDQSDASDGVISQFGSTREFTPSSDEQPVSNQQLESESAVEFNSASEPVTNSAPRAVEPTNDSQVDNNQSQTEEDKMIINVSSNVETAGSVKVTSSLNYSPNEQVYLMFEEHTISVYDSLTGKIIKQWPKAIDGEYQFDRWAEDSLSFTYIVTDASGEERSYSERIDDGQ